MYTEFVSKYKAKKYRVPMIYANTHSDEMFLHMSFSTVNGKLRANVLKEIRNLSLAGCISMTSEQDSKSLITFCVRFNIVQLDRIMPALFPIIEKVLDRSNWNYRNLKYYDLPPVEIDFEDKMDEIISHLVIDTL